MRSYLCTGHPLPARPSCAWGVAFPSILGFLKIPGASVSPFLTANGFSVHSVFRGCFHFLCSRSLMGVNRDDRKPEEMRRGCKAEPWEGRHVTLSRRKRKLGFGEK